MEAKTFSGAFGSEPNAEAKQLKGTLPGYLADAMDKPGSCQKRFGRAFSAKMDRRFGESGVYLKKGKLLNGRQQWEVIIPQSK
jgi:hypothetical protein